MGRYGEPVSISKPRRTAVAALLAVGLVAASALVGGASAAAAPSAAPAPQVACGVAPTVASVSPSSGPQAGGTLITISGGSFRPDTTVSVGGAAASDVTILNPTTLTAVTPSGTGVADVVVATGAGSASVVSGFIYVAVAPVPTLSSVSPDSGPIFGGTQVALSGTGFSSVATVSFGAAAASNVTVVSDTLLFVTTPASVAGAVSVTVSGVGGSATQLDAYTYVSGPFASSLSPSSGSIAGGTAVTVSGGNFVAGATMVMVDGTTIPAGSVTVNSFSSLTFTTPAHVSGNVAVTVTTGGGSASAPGGFTYVGAPTLTSVTPNQGPTLGGTSVTLSGSAFVAGATQVSVDGTTVPTSGVAVINSSTLTFTTPPHVDGVVDVAVTTAGGTATASGAYVYLSTPAPVMRMMAPLVVADAAGAADPTIAVVAPASGPVGGGTRITVTGTGFPPTVSVTVGGVAATSISVDGATTLSATVPASASASASMADVVLLTENCFVRAAAAFSYVVAASPVPSAGSGVSPSPTKRPVSGRTTPVPAPEAPASTSTPSPTATPTPGSTPPAAPAPSSTSTPSAAPDDQPASTTEFPWWILIVGGVLLLVVIVGGVIFARRT